MTALPASILDYLGKIMVEKHALAYLLVDRQGWIKATGGELSRYGLELKSGEVIGEELCFLIGFLPFDGPPMQLTYVKVSAGISADIHLFSTDEGDWVLFADVTEEESKYGLMQQRVNDLSLLREQQLRKVNQFFDDRVTELREHEQLPFRATGERKELAILCGEFKYSADDNRRTEAELTQTEAESTIKLLKLYLRTITPAIVDEGGFISTTIGNRFIAVFGALTSTDAPARQAIRAALQILEKLKNLNQDRDQDQFTTFEIGISITTGAAIIGVIDAKAQHSSKINQRSINIIGDVTSIALRLIDQAINQQILIDEPAYQAADELAKLFIDETINLSHHKLPEKIFSYKS